MLNNANFSPADIRMTIFCNQEEWLIIFETIVFANQQNIFVNIIHAYGNKLASPGMQLAKDILSAPVSSSLWDQSGKFLLDRWNIDVVINGVVKKFSLTPSDYQAAGIDFNSNMISELQILRVLTFLCPELFFLSPTELLERCNRPQLEVFMELTSWNHPDIVSGEVPSNNECFQNLARAIANQDKNLYSCSQNHFNTHWSQW